VQKLSKFVVYDASYCTTITTTTTTTTTTAAAVVVVRKVIQEHPESADLCQGESESEVRIWSPDDF